MNRGIKRQKGGVEKTREKSRKLLLADSEKCAKLTDSFFKPLCAASASSTIALMFKTLNKQTSACYFRACEVISVCCGHACACASPCGALVGENAGAVF